MNRGVVMINTGNGKGKTTASIGLTIRALGHSQQVSFIHFIKGGQYGEHTILKRFSDLLDLKTMGVGFTKNGDKSEHRLAALAAWDYAKDKITSGEQDLIVLDEFTYVLKYNYLDIATVIETLGNRPSHVSVVITGRDAPPGLVDFADMVSDITMVKHHYEAGVPAQKGVEF